MRSYLLLTVCVVLLLSCKKEKTAGAVDPPASKRVLLKDVTIPNLPSPYYHFEYTDSIVTKAAFASGLSAYDVLYSGNKVSDMRNNIISNRDTLRYLYDQSGRLYLIKFINSANVVYRRVTFSFEADKVKEIEWDHKEGSTGFLIDRTLSFTFYADGNVKTITERRPATSGSPETITVKTFEQYDDNVNVDDFSLVHDGFHDHLFLLQGFRLQKNNPRKELLSSNGTNIYTIDYTYTYNSDKTPSNKSGDMLFVGGPNAGQRFQTNSSYTYY